MRPHKYNAQNNVDIKVNLMDIAELFADLKIWSSK